MTCRKLVKLERGMSSPLQRGDHIQMPLDRRCLGRCLTHHAIVEDCKKEGDKSLSLTVIEIPDKGGRLEKKLKIEKNTRNVDIKQVTLVDYRKRKYNHSETYNRALKFISNQQQNSVQNADMHPVQNFEHNTDMHTAQNSEHNADMHTVQNFEHNTDMHTGQNYEHNADLHPVQNFEHNTDMHTEQNSEHNADMHPVQNFEHNTDMHTEQSSEHNADMHPVQNFEHNTDMHTAQNSKLNADMHPVHNFEHNTDMHTEQNSEHIDQCCSCNVKRYNLLYRNCEHFAAACVNGQGELSRANFHKSTSLQTVKCCWLSFDIVIAIFQCIFFITNFYIYAVYVQKDEDYNHFPDFLISVFNCLNCYDPDRSFPFIANCDWWAIVVFAALYVLVFVFFAFLSILLFK